MKHTVSDPDSKTNCVLDLASLERQVLKDSTKNKRLINSGEGVNLENRLLLSFSSSIAAIHVPYL